MPAEPMTPDNIKAVAEGLTTNTKEFLCSPMYGARSHDIDEAWFHGVGLWAGRVTAKLGLVERRRMNPGIFASIPTDIGLAVRAYLQQETQP